MTTHSLHLRRTSILPVVLSMAIQPCWCQAPQTSAPSPLTQVISVAPYEVASIRIDHSNGMSGHASTNNGTLLAENISLAALIRFAYSLPKELVVGGPAWLDDTKFDIHAKTEGLPHVDLSTLSIEEREAYNARVEIPLRLLLQDRFQLKLHREDRVMPMYALVVAKGGLKIKPSNEKSSLGEYQRADMSAHVTGIVGAPGLRIVGRGKVVAAKVTLDQLAMFLTRAGNGDVDRPVMNKTSLSGRYDFTLEWTTGLGSDDSGSAPGLFAAIQEQLGLKLEPQKGAVPILVIDHAELPTEN